MFTTCQQCNTKLDYRCPAISSIPGDYICPCCALISLDRHFRESSWSFESKEQYHSVAWQRKFNQLSAALRDRPELCLACPSFVKCMTV